jgi:serine/threonine protein kinase
MAPTSTHISRLSYSHRPTAPAGHRHHELSPGTTLGRYAVLREIGRGSHGVVYEGFDLALRRPVALKSVGRDLGPKHADEAGFLSAIASPHVVALFDTVDRSEAAVLVLELVNGPTIDAVIRGATATAGDVASLGIQLAAGLHAIHSAGFVHGDIKPSNLRLTERGILKVLDLGIARRMTRPADARSAAASLVAGTVPYMPPEQFLGGEGDVRSDIWSAGAVLFELATGRRAYDALPPAARLHGLRDAHFAGVHLFAAEVPSLLAEAIGTAMHPIPGRRFQTAEEMRNALEAAEESEARCVLTGAYSKETAPMSVPFEQVPVQNSCDLRSTSAI